jgi:glycosyltransferase involved in cell wall biosynthesis
MRLTILTQYYPPEMGAPQARLSGLARAFRRRGHDVTVLTALPNYPTGRVFSGYRAPWRRETIEGVRVVRVPLWPSQSAGMVPRMASYLSFVLTSALAGSIFLPRPDYLLVESPPLFLGMAAWWLTRLRGGRLIFNVSDLWPASAVNLGVVDEGGMPYRLACRLEAACYRAAWLVTGQSREIVADIAARFPECLTYHLSNAVDTDAFRPDRASPEVRARLGDGSSCLAVYAGLHGLAQGLGQLLDAAEIVGPSVAMTLIGDGPEKPTLMSEAGRRALSQVRFLDPLRRSEVPAAVASADIVLVPLRAPIPGAVPSKLYEAMASGRPVVLVATGEAADIVRRCDAGLVVRPGDIAELARALERLSQDPGLRARLGANGRRAAEAEFNRQAIGDRFVDLLESGL